MFQRRHRRRPSTQLYPNPQQFLAPPPGQAPLPQTVIDSAKMIELGHFYHILGAFAQACVQAYRRPGYKYTSNMRRGFNYTTRLFGSVSELIQ